MLFSDWLESLETLCSAFSLASKPVQAIIINIETLELLG